MMSVEITNKLGTMPSQYVKLNVGGSLHQTTIQTLTKYDSMFKTVFSGELAAYPDSEGWHVIDRCGKHFGTVLNFLRDGEAPLPESPQELKELLTEADYYCLSELSEACLGALTRIKTIPETLHRGSVIGSDEEVSLLISTSNRPIVQLTVVSPIGLTDYISMNNYLKNIQLFDDLLLKFGEQIHFIKKVLHESFNLNWSFYLDNKVISAVHYGVTVTPSGIFYMMSVAIIDKLGTIPSQFVKLNVGGSFHQTTIQTLTKFDTMLKAMFSGELAATPDSEGCYVIDRCGKHFETILNFLRDGEVPLPESSRELLELQTEANYYSISQLSLACTTALSNKQEIRIMYRGLLIVSDEEEKLLISTSDKPIVRWSIYRGNSSSNIQGYYELFDKLSLKFSERIHFIKKVNFTHPICDWDFFWDQNLTAQVSCYRKNLNEFNEARIEFGNINEQVSNLLFKMLNHKTVIKGNPSQYVKLNVGGSLHYTTIGTLTKHDTMLRAMFSGRMEVLTDSEGWILIDRCGKHFGTVLNFLRDGEAPLPESPRGLAELLAEAKYFCISDLSESCERALSNKNTIPEPICRVPLITSQKEENLLITTSPKPIVKLLINRHNNKYSYTNTSDDNLLKNIELFDKLSLRFSDRMLFIKDVIGSNEICCWSFYGHGKKAAEVCCTSIVYATDKKHTKVEFPEARIYEETLHIILYERSKGPDQELMQATSTRGAGVAGMSAYTSDEEEERSGLARLRSNKKNP